ncbi:valine--tRNA ligase [Clostridia bacterium]|nr:valine--tRNA ligase [Clostridia bacterium]
MKREWEKVYSPQNLEKRIYEKWLAKHYFRARVNQEKKPFTIIMPPPNITGKLHLGHALDNTMQDAIIRFKRMQGYEALWQPGCDHASISTEIKIWDMLKKEGKNKNNLNREEFLKRAWEWKEEYGGNIIHQLKLLGASADWERERFTMDASSSKAVKEAFIRLHEKGYIYRASRIIQWCPHCGTSLSDAEVDYQEKEGHLWTIRYLLEDSAKEKQYVEIATTRPETLLGDTALAVHPEDIRYQDLIGKYAFVPLINRKILIVADDYVDQEFGTGVVKITPAHDPNDFELGKRHQLEEITVLDNEGKINANGGVYEGMSKEEARKQIVHDLENQGLLSKVSPHTHNVGTHERCGTIIEPLIKLQWFVRMEELAKPAIASLKEKRLNFIPEHFDKAYLRWLENIRDWCISRQLWWGHQIPAYYCKNCGEIQVCEEKPGICPSCGLDQWEQDEDVLDTWFSSALWPFSTLGWPEQSEDFSYFYPTQVLTTGYDILFFWVIRMVFSALEHTQKEPFSTVLLHGLIRDENGKKMSKSLGNGIDPLDVIQEYGADALRLSLLTGNAPGNDMRFYHKKVEASRNFVNKVWNATRFILLNLKDQELAEDMPRDLQTVDCWILSSLNQVIDKTTKHLEKYELGFALQTVSDFLWEEFCDWYIEMVKPRLQDKAEGQKEALWTLKEVLINVLKLLHPFMPFVTEELFGVLQEREDSIMVSSWPIVKTEHNFLAAVKKVDQLKESIKELRTLRTDLKVPAKNKIQIYVVSVSADVRNNFLENQSFFSHLAAVSEVFVGKEKPELVSKVQSIVLAEATIYVPLDQLVDVKQEEERLKKELEKAKKEWERAKQMLDNENFRTKAPRVKIQEEEEKKENYQKQILGLEERLKQIQKKA